MSMPHCPALLASTALAEYFLFHSDVVAQQTLGFCSNILIFCVQKHLMNLCKAVNLNAIRHVYGIFSDYS